VPASYYGARASDVMAECPEVNLTMWQGNETVIARAGGSVFCGENLPPAFVAHGSVILNYNYR
jgi:hypothetical protein